MQTQSKRGSLTRRLACLWGTVLATPPVLAKAEPVMVAVAANFAAPMRQIAGAFERSTGYRVVMALGSTGSLYALIRNGAPFHLLLAADEVTPLRLESEALAAQGTRGTYAVGRLVLWSVTPGRVDEQGTALRSASVARLAIANPRLAPYGRAAQQVIDREGLASSLRDKLVLGESVGQAYQFVASGNVDMGFVALAQVMHGEQLQKGSAWIVPATLHDPIRQDLVLLNPGRSHAGALALRSYLLGPTAQAIVRAHGYTP